MFLKNIYIYLLYSLVVWSYIGRFASTHLTHHSEQIAFSQFEPSDYAQLTGYNKVEPMGFASIGC